ncbi:MAG TPA: hypothetical protein VGH87_06775 [Polyangiaceae bacterium]
MRWAAGFLIACMHCVGDDSVANDAGSDAIASDASVDAPSSDAKSDVVVVDAGCTADTQNDKKNCGTCGHDCVGGQCSAGVCQVATLVAGQAAISAIAPTQTKLYWSRGATTTQHGGIFSSDLDGQNLAMLYDGNSSYCMGLQVTSNATYFDCGNEIYKCALPSCSQTPTPLLAMSGVAATALDATNQALYFSVGTPYNQQTGGFVASMPLSGTGSYTRLVTADQPSPNSLLIANGVVYWLDSGTYTNDNITGNGGVRSAPLGTNQIFADLVNDKTAIDYTGLALSGSTIYYGIGSGNAIHSVATIGGSFSTYTTSTTNEILVLIADANALYWADNSKIEKCALGSCTTPQTFASGQNPSVMAQDTASVWWANGGGEIRRLAK